MSNSSKAAAVVSNGCHLKGDLTLSGPLHVNGMVEGNIRSSGAIVIGASGKVTGDVHSTTVMVNGSCSGNIRTGTIEVLEHGVVSGSIYSDNCVIAKGGIINGKVVFGQKKNKK